MVMGIIDGLPSLEKIFKAEIPKARAHSCQADMSFNALDEVPKKLKKDVADDLRSISSKDKTIEFLVSLEIDRINCLP